MTDQERINENLQRQIDAQNARIDNTLTKIDMMMEEIRDIRAETRDIRDDMRRLWERQDEERRAREDEMREAQAKHDADMREMNQRFYQKIDSMDNKFDKFSSQLQTMSLTTILGVGAIVWAIVSALK